MIVFESHYRKICDHSKASIDHLSSRLVLQKMAQWVLLISGNVGSLNKVSPYHRSRFLKKKLNAHIKIFAEFLRSTRVSYFAPLQTPNFLFVAQLRKYVLDLNVVVQNFADMLPE